MQERWTDADDNFLRLKYSEGEAVDVIARRLGKSYKAVTRRAARLCIKHQSCRHDDYYGKSGQNPTT